MLDIPPDDIVLAVTVAVAASFLAAVTALARWLRR
jgi:hypothetical protein